MFVQADHSPSKLLELPSTWLASLVQHVASGSGGLDSAAALSQSCKSFHALSESSAVTYRNIHVDRPLHRLNDPFWRWLAKRRIRMTGLTVVVKLLTLGNHEAERELLQMIFGIPGLHLTLCWRSFISTPDHPFLTKVLRPHAHLIDHLSTLVVTNRDRLKLQDFCKAAAPCRSLDLIVGGSFQEPLNMGDLNPVAGSLVGLDLRNTNCHIQRELESVSSLSRLSRLYFAHPG